MKLENEKAGADSTSDTGLNETPPQRRRKPGADVRIWMPIYIGDLLARTMRFKTVEHGALILLKCEYWQKGQPLPDDDLILSLIAGMTPEEWQTHRPAISEQFEVADGMWRNPVWDSEIEDAIAKREKKSAAGKRGAAKRWHGEGNGTANGTAIAKPLAEGCPLPSPSPIEVEREEPPVEPPRGFPKTKEEAVAMAGAIGCPDDFVEKIWDAAMGRGGRDAKDIPIRSFVHHLSAMWKYDREDHSKASSIRNISATAKAVPLFAQIKATETLIADVNRELRAIPSYAASVFPAEHAAAEAKRKPLREKKARLVEQLQALKEQEARAGADADEAA